ncbi:MAG: SDR family oxidoreductase [Chloroflexi bacterium]|nr:MAG: SDR family oxidoreductase [Chloroflexota bacterium]
MMSQKYVLITGVSSGIGYAAAAELVARGYHVFGSVRREADAARVQQALGEEGFTPLLFDVTDEAAVKTAVSHVETVVGENGLTALINNAGIAIAGPLMHMPLDTFRQQFEVNLFGLLHVTQCFLPLLGARQNCPHPPGRIINISSVSGRIAYPFMGAYAASKHALEALSDALRRELMLYGVDVIVIEPGTVRTPIVGKFGEQITAYANTDYAPVLFALEKSVGSREASALPVERVTKVIVTALESKRPKTRYAIPRKRLTGWWLPRWLPDRWLDRLVGRQLGFR